MKSPVQYIFIFLLCIQFQTNANDYIFEPITNNTGITFNGINSVIEDKYGFIWFGSNSGLYYYNSSSITKFNFDSNNPDTPNSNVVRYLYKDKKNNLWLCTNEGVYMFNENSNSFLNINLSLPEDITQINATRIEQISAEDYLIISNGSLFTFNLVNLELENVKLGTPGTSIYYFVTDLSGNIYFSANDNTIYKSDSLITSIRPIYKTRPSSVTTLSLIDDQLWIGYFNEGIEIITLNGDLVNTLGSDKEGKQHIIKDRIRRIIKYEDEIWVGTQGGITVIRKNFNFDITPNRHNGLPHKGIFDLYADHEHGIWVATWSGGLAYYHKLNFKFPHIQSTPEDRTRNKSVISSFSEDRKGRILIGAENHGLHVYNPKNNIYGKKKDSPFLRIKSIISDKDNRIWIGTLFDGVWLLNNNILTKKINIDGIISSVLPVQDGIWIGKRVGGVVFYDLKNNTVKYYKKKYKDTLSICSNSIWDIIEDSHGNIWFSSDNGISVKYKDTDYFTNYYKDTDGLSSNINYSLAEDKNGNIWIGTSGYGIDIYDHKTKTFSKFSLNNKLDNSEIYCILKDKKNNMWFSSNRGITAYYHNSHKLKHFTAEDGLSDQQFHPNSGYVSKEGILYFGGGNGFNIINPEIVQPNTVPTEIYISTLLINGEDLSNHIPKYINSNYLPQINDIELKYNQNSIDFAFVTNSFIKNTKSKFKYRLLDYINEWNISDYDAIISFTKLPPGEYTLQVEYLNSDELSLSPLKEIRIEIKPPFWLSTFAYSLYTLVILTIIFIAMREFRYREKTRSEKLLFTEKVKFFTNVSHEFRTPLTLIISPLNNLMKKFSDEPEIFENLKIIHRNADRLLRLTNQILDFRLIEINSVKIKRENVDLITLCKNVFDCFEFQVKEKEINYIFKSSFNYFKLFVDPEKIEKVIYNILSNAFRYSNEKGQIILAVGKINLSPDSYSQIFFTGNKFTGEALEIKIKDNGKGIKKNILSKIFERFFVDSESNETGTGIGLHICQEYIRLHNGNIMVESAPGNGAVFSINIPIDSKQVYENKPIILQSFFDKAEKKERKIQEFDSKTKPVILFAEDNKDLRLYFKNLLSSKYKIITAKNGSQAFEIASELIPNLIISDILMPGMDGISLTSLIRKTPELNHIPIILVTALSDHKVEIDSMHKGANAFLTKPFDEELLFAKIESVLKNEELIKNKYKKEGDRATGKTGSNLSFIERVEQIVDANLQNQSFEITELASQIGISRSSLQRKIKGTVNMCPSEFIREIRLKKAVSLLKDNEYNIDEIAIIVGFNSTSYFIRSFKKKYEMTPTEYKQRLEK